MKHSLLVATIAAATLLTACGSKNEAAKVGGGNKQKVTSVNNEPSYTDLMYQDLENGPWLGECGDSSVFSYFTGNSERTVVSFENARMTVSTVSYDLADCKGEATEKVVSDVNYRLTATTSRHSEVPWFTIKQEVYGKSSVHNDSGALAVGQYFVAVDGDKMTLNAMMKNKKISEETLVLTRQAAPVVLGTERF